MDVPRRPGGQRVRRAHPALTRSLPNLFVEYFPQVLSETFTLSLLTAVLLKAILEIGVAAKDWGGGLRETSTTLG